MGLDLKLTWNAVEEYAQLAFADNDIVADRSLLTPIIVSLFTDARAKDDDVLPDPRSTDRRGWWADATNTAKRGDQIGSRLWLLERAKTTAATVPAAKRYAEEALQWLVDEGIAASVKVSVESVLLASQTWALTLSVVVTKPSGTTETYKFAQEWEETIDGS
jgi:phage gp46-like protein